MKDKKDKQKIGDIFFGKAGEVFTNARLFLRFKKFAKIISKEKKAVEDARAKLAKLYGGAVGEIGEMKKAPEKKTELQEFALLQKKIIPTKKQEPVFVPLAEVAKNSTYSKNYINYSARQGKLKAKKIKGVWHTTEEWLADFTETSKAKKNKFKEKMSHDLGGNKKFVAEIAAREEPADVLEERTVPKTWRGIGMIGVSRAIDPFLRTKKTAGKFLARNWSDAKAWVRELGEMNDAKESAKLRKAKLADFWKLDFAKPVAAMIALVMLMAVGNITKADLGHWGDQGKKRAYFAYNAGVDAAEKIVSHVNGEMGKQIAKVKIGKEKFVKIAEDVLRREKIIDFEKNSGLSLRGDEKAKGEIAGVETKQGGDAGQLISSSAGKVLAAETSTAQVNAGDIEVSAYLMDGENKELTNGEYDVRFGIYTTDRTESDPFPSDTDKGSRVWEETQKVTVENGLLKTYLGATTPIPASFNFAASNYYIGIRVAEDAEMTPRKRIGAVPLARTAMNAITVNGLTVGNAAGNVPTSNGTLNTNLNADLLDGQHAAAFQVAGSYQPAGSYDNYLAWKLQSSSTDAGQKINTNKGAIFVGANGIVTSRLLSTLTVSPTYGSEDNTIAQGSTIITVDTTGNMQGGGSGTAGGGINLTLNTIDSPTFTTVSLTTLDLGTNTITDGNFTGDWSFNTGNLTNIASAIVTGNFNLTASTNLIFGGVTSLGETTSPTDSGAYMVGANDEFANSASTNVQGVLNDLDAAIAGGGPGGMWTLAGGTIYPTDLTNNFEIGGGYGSAGVSISNIGNVQANGNLTVDGTVTSGLINSQTISASASFTGTVTAATSFLAPTFDTSAAAALNIGTATQTGLTLGRAGAATTINGSALTIGPTSWTATPTISGLVTATSGLTSTGTLTASNGLTLTTGALNLTATSGSLALSGLSASSINTGANNLTITSGAFNTTATGINGTAIGATTASTGAFTTLSSSGITNLGTSGASNVNIATTGTGATAIGNATGTFQLSSSGGLNVTTGGALTGVASLDTINVSSTALTFTGAAPTISVSTAATAINLDAGTTGVVNIAGTSTGNVNLAGGSAGTGCTVTNATGDFACTGNITGSSSGTVGFWSRTGTTLSQATANDALSLGSGTISTTGTVTSGLINSQTISASASFTGTVTAATSFLAPTFDTSAAAALNIGTATQTGLTLGRAGAATTINGSALTIGPTSWTATPTISGLVTATSGLTSTGTLTASNGLTLTTGALNLTATSGSLALSGLSASSINTGANNLTITSGAFNTTATGINGTAIGATTASTGAFTTLSSSGITNLGTSGASNVNIATTGTGATAIGNATGTFQLSSSGGLNVTTGGALTGVASLDTINVSSTALTFTGAAPTISVSTAATAINLDAGTTGVVNIAGTSTGNVNLAGGSAGTGCTVTNATGDFACTGNITGSSSGTVGFWSRTGTTLSQATANDALSLGSGTISTTGTVTSGLINSQTISASASFTGTVTAATSFLAPTFDTSAAAALNIGTATQTGLTLGRAGAATTINGSALTIGPTSWTATPTISGLVTATSGLTSTGTLTASNGLTLTTGALNLTATSGSLALSGLSASSINTGANNLTITSGAFNTTATGINGTAIGATTASTGAFTTLSSSGITNLGTSGASNVNIATTGTGATAIGNATGTFQLSSSGGLNVTTGGALTGVASLDTINVSSTALTFTGAAPTISVSTAATAINLDAGTTGVVNIAGTSTGNVNLAGGSAGTGCTVTNATGDFACTGNITGSSSGTVGFWSRTGTTLSQATANDALSLGSGTISTTGTVTSGLINSQTISASASFTGTVTAATSFLAPTFDTSAAAALNIGTATQTGLTLGRAGAATTINGSALTIGPTSWTATPTISGLVTATSGLTSTGTLTASNGLTLTTGALNLTATSGSLALSGLSASSINTGANNLTITSGAFNTTATGINGTAIGATTASTGAFTTLSSTGQFTSTLATGTSPFNVTSTTMNANLNADLLDGQHGAYYAAAASISGTQNYLAKFNAGGTSIGNSMIFDNGASVGIGTTTLSGVKFKIANGGSSSVSDSYNDQSKIASAVNSTVSSSQLHVSETNCGTYSVLDADGNTYDTVLVNGRCWLDRNLGATTVATNTLPVPTTSYGYLFQWGRSRDGHQQTLYSNGANSATTDTLSATDTVSAPDTAKFIKSPIANFDWKTNATKNDELWRGGTGNGGANNPCPTGFRVPTQPEWSAVATAIGLTTANCGGTDCRVTAASSLLHLPPAGNRNFSNAALSTQGSYGLYWSSGPNGTFAYGLLFSSTGVYPAYYNNRAYGFSVRCVKD